MNILRQVSIFCLRFICARGVLCSVRECNVLGVCTPHPGPNNFHVVQTWNGVLLDFFFSIALPLLLVGFFFEFCF